MYPNNKNKPELNQADSEKKLPTRGFLGVWIPKEIWLMKDLSITAKAVWAEIQSLHDDEKGGCFASNEYLAEFTGLKVRALQDILSQLRAKGLIKTVSFNGRERILQAVEPKNAAYQTCRKLHGSNAENCTHIIKNINKEISSKEDIKKVARAPIQKKIGRAVHVDISDHDHQKLEDKYGKEVRDWCYKRLSEWKQDKPKRQWTKCDYRTILRWVVDAYHEEQLKKKKRQEFDGGEKNKALAEKIANNFQSIAKNKGIRIDVNMTAITFVFLTAQKNPITIKYSETGFKEQVDNLMRKYKLL